MEQFGTLVGSISGTTIGTIVIGTLTGSIRGSCWTLIGSVNRSMNHLSLAEYYFCSIHRQGLV